MIMMMMNNDVDHDLQQNINDTDNATTIIIEPEQQLQQNTMSHENDDNDDENINNDNNNNNLYWVDDQWTDEDCIIAQSQLNEYASKCRIEVDNEAIKKKKRKKFTKKYNHYLSKNHDNKTNNNNNNNDNYHAWNQFYIGNTNKFFKDRHYLSIDFPNEFNNQRKILRKEMTTNHCCFIEMGCGVGNTLLPLLEMKTKNININDEEEVVVDDNNNNNNDNHYYPWLFTHLYGFDISPAAIDILQQDVRYQTYAMKTTISKSNNDVNNNVSSNNNKDNYDSSDDDQCQQSSLPSISLPQIHVEVCDISIPYSISHQYENIANVVSLLFCLSAIDPSNHINTIQNVIRTLKSPTPIIIDNEIDDTSNRIHSNCTTYHDDGGIIIFRDYGRYDEAQMKLSRQNSKLLPTTTIITTSTKVTSKTTTSTMKYLNVTNVDNVDHHDLNDDDNHHLQLETPSTSIQNDNNDNNDTTYSHFYIKNDGTKCYYFTIEDLITIFHIHGQLKVLECQYIYRTYYNRSLQSSRRRVWIQGRFQKIKP